MEKSQDIQEGLTIQQVVLVTGLSAHTLRYYERAGLMQDRVGRNDANGRRYYTQQDIDWIEFIKCLRAAGMPIRDVRHYTELIRQGEETITERMQLLKQHQKRIKEHLNEVEKYLSAITTKIECNTQQGGFCPSITANSRERQAVLI